MPHDPLFADARRLRDAEELRIAVEPYRGQLYASIRRWYIDREGGEWKPGKGTAVLVAHVPWLRHALERAEAALLEAGELDEESYDAAGLALPAQLTGAT